jgi:hypothetical protein
MISTRKLINFFHAGGISNGRLRPAIKPNRRFLAADRWRDRSPPFGLFGAADQVDGRRQKD